MSSHEVVVNTIAATRTRAGLRVDAALDVGDYPTGIAISKQRFEALPLQRHVVHGAWNYTLRPESVAADAVPIDEQAGPAGCRQGMLIRLADPRLTGMSGAEAPGRGIPAEHRQNQHADRFDPLRLHKIANPLGALPKSAHPGAKKALAQIWNAEDRDHALDAVKAFSAAYGAKFPKVVAKITDDLEVLLAFYDFPAEHWIHLRTTIPIESTFAAVRHRTKSPRAPAPARPGWPWPSSSSRPPRPAGQHPHLVALVRAGATFRNGKPVERPDATTDTTQAAAKAAADASA